MDLYDEFGNYIGGDADADADGDDDDALSLGDAHDAADEAMDTDLPAASSLRHASREETALVLHEDKKYYQDAEELYPTAKTVTFNTDAMNLDEPIIKPAAKVLAPSSSSAARRRVVEEALAFQVDLMASPAFTRHVALIGNIHHGKVRLGGRGLGGGREREGGRKETEEGSRQRGEW